jgi:RsmE family RNA methyltransferase
MHFFVPNLNNRNVVREEAAHFFSLRVKAGQEVSLTNLQGQRQRVKLTFVDKKLQKVAWEVLEFEKIEPPAAKILFQAWPDKNYLEKLVEILAFSNFTQIYLFPSAFSPKQNLNLSRLNKILIRACELAERAFLPQLYAVQSLGEIENLLLENRPTVLERETGDGPKVAVNYQACLVGPEGGWSAAELANFRELNLPFQFLGSTVYPAWLAGFVWQMAKPTNNELLQ